MKRALLIAAAIALVAVTAADARVYTVTLENGTTFQTRYEPVAPDWDPTLTVFLTDQGNWIALKTEEIADIASDLETAGFGYQLDTSAIIVGFSPNNLETEDGEPGTGPGTGQGAGAEPPPPDYTIEQFVNTSSPGDSSGGIPVGFVR